MRETTAAQILLCSNLQQGQVRAATRAWGSGGGGGHAGVGRGAGGGYHWGGGGGGMGWWPAVVIHVWCGKLLLFCFAPICSRDRSAQQHGLGGVAGVGAMQGWGGGPGGDTIGGGGGGAEWGGGPGPESIYIYIYIYIYIEIVRLT